MSNFKIKCPCCEAIVTIDSDTGAVISFEANEKPLGTFEDLKSDLAKKSELRDQIFDQEQKAQKDRARILEEKFQEAIKKADTDSDEPFRNPLDFD